MSESNGATAHEKAPLSPVERAEALIVRAQERVAARQRAAGSAPVESGTESSGEATTPTTPVIERADVLLDQTGEKLGRLATILSQHVRKAGALLREEAEDMVAEAQAIRTKQP